MTTFDRTKRERMMAKLNDAEVELYDARKRLEDAREAAKRIINDLRSNVGTAQAEAEKKYDAYHRMRDALLREIEPAEPHVHEALPSPRDIAEPVPVPLPPDAVLEV
jgi:predicted  nucleic acid-binding Zn-ribbon protein